MQYSQRRWCTATVSVLVLSALVLLAHGATIKFDQSQTGDYNLQIHLKNIELYAVFDDSGGNDDEYEDLPDYTDTLEGPTKPPQNASTTYAPTSSTAATAAAVVSTSSPALALLDPYSQSNSDKIVQMVEALIASNGNTSDLPTEQPLLSPNVVTTSSSPPASGQSLPAVATASAAASATATVTNSTVNRKCGPGYFRDPMGRCRRIRKPHLPFLQMVHTPGVIKSFQPQQRTTEDVSVMKN
ncbi:uncharacterized protein LOC113554607 [Rhopalosiphum maidis]|uniref:uncharacterized protein LOC113554607 n=1 Tax=Rhopalosiphum maidis TaxID=43146 RepID=UPI000EFE087B|nr:uncharacterized protein LOC113554607 [Rhopalosiphum maidis]